MVSRGLSSFYNYSDPVASGAYRFDLVSSFNADGSGSLSVQYKVTPQEDLSRLEPGTDS